MEEWAMFHESSKRKYYVSNLGRIKSVTHLGFEQIIKRQFVADSNNAPRYQVSVSRSNARRFYVHSLVAKYFVANPSGFKLVEFIDGNPKNCIAENICWGRRISYFSSKNTSISTFSDVEAKDLITQKIAGYIVRGNLSDLNSAWSLSYVPLARVVKSHLFKLLSRVPSDDLVLDVVQESLMKAQAAIDRGLLKTPKNVQGWLATIARNTAVNYGKSNKHLSVNLTENHNGEEFSLYDQQGANEHAYTPSWGFA